VETWGAPDASCAIVAASLADRATDPVSIPFRTSLPTEALSDLLIIKGVPLIAAPAGFGCGEDERRGE
jgi:hypothetical protein